MSSSPHSPGEDDSDVSDVEEEGYCDDTKTDNIKMLMRLEKVRHSRIKKLYTNTEKVSNTVTAELKTSGTCNGNLARPHSYSHLS